MDKKRLKRLIFILFAFLTAFLLRIYKLDTNFSFSGEFGDNLLDVKNAFEIGKLPLVGPPTSHPWLYFGPLYIWLMMPLMKMFNFNPLAAAYFGAFAGSIVVIIHYFVVSRVFNKNLAKVSSLIMVLSPLLISFSRSARFYFLVTLLFYPFLWALKRIWEKEDYFLTLGFVVGLFFSFHYSPVILLPSALLIIYLKRKHFNLKNYAKGFVGLAISLLPVLVYDFKSGLVMTRNFLLWFPYRIAGFLGLYEKNNLTTFVFKENIRAINDFLGLILTTYKLFWPFISLGFIWYLARKVRLFKKKKISFEEIALYLSTIIGFMAVFIHGSAPIHYFLPLFPIATIIFAKIISFLWKDSQKRFFAILVVILFVVINLSYFFTSPSFFGKQKKVSLNPHYVNYLTQIEISKFIINSAKGEKFSLKRVGPDDQFEENYSQNYKYLLWWMGNEPQENKNLVYTIYEDVNRLDEKTDEQVFRLEDVVITKKINE